ncbi:MAG: HYR domain-containing protein, partial [Crocinitomicaceae bacterium]|nr:HYR domain-containing protein [Crocinitomicaceae bacterium]
TNTFVVTDASGNTATCSFNVTVNDTELPTITCNAPITVSNDAGVCGAVVTYTNTSTDNCPGQVITQTAGLASGSVFPIGTTTNTFVVTDASGNTATCSFNVTVNDTELPTITCNAPITVNNDAGVCGAVVTYTNTSTDNCPGQVITQTAGLASGSVFPIGTTTNTFVVTDASGNTATCSFNVTVNDTELPTITCNAPITVSNDAGVCGAVVTYTNTSTDNCPGQVITQTAGLASGSVFPIGTTTNTFVVTDASGNTATCSFNVTVNDTELPTIVCSANITQTADAGVCDAAVIVPAPVNGDNCAVATIVNSYNGTSSANDTYPVGTTTITWTVTDVNGNINTCIQDVTITDNEIPTIVCSHEHHSNSRCWSMRRGCNSTSTGNRR